MQVGVVQQVLTPTVEHGEEADPGAEVLGGGADGAQGFGGGAEQNAIDHFLVLAGDRGNLFRQRKDHMEILGVEEFGAAIFQPFRARQRLAFWALVRAWYLKESFQLFWAYKQPWRAKQHLLKWMDSAMRSRLEPFKKFVRMLRSHLDGILAWTKTRLSNGAVEGMNNKIKSISHRSFGFRSAENFIAAIYH